jgi:hypothetical protein
MMRDAVVEATDFKREAEELRSRAEIAEKLFQSEEEKASLEQRLRLQENAEAETFMATAEKKLKKARVQAQKEVKKANIAREKERWGYEARIAQAHMRVVEIASEVHENTEERVAEATNELVHKLKKCELASKRVCASHVVELNALKSKHEAQSANLLRYTREEQELAKSKQKEETQLLKSGHDAAVQGLEREHAHEVQSLKNSCNELQRISSSASVGGLCKSLLSAHELEIISKIPSIESFGIEAASVADMSTKRKGDMAKITGMLCDAVLNIMKAGSPDPVGVVGAMMSRRDSKASSIGLFVNSAASTGADTPHLATLAASFQKATRSGDKRVARQMLSLAVEIEGISDAMIMEAFSEDFAIVVGDNVEVTMSGNKVSRFRVCLYFHSTIII